MLAWRKTSILSRARGNAGSRNLLCTARLNCRARKHTRRALPTNARGGGSSAPRRSCNLPRLSLSPHTSFPFVRSRRAPLNAACASRHIAPHIFARVPHSHALRAAAHSCVSRAAHRTSPRDRAPRTSLRAPGGAPSLEILTGGYAHAAPLTLRTAAPRAHLL